MTEPLFASSPAWTIADDTLIGFDLSFTQGLDLVGVDTYALADEAVVDLSAQLTRALSDLPDGYLLRFYALELARYDDLLDRYRRQLAGAPLGAAIAEEKVRQCSNTLSPRRRELLCFVSSPPATGTRGGYPSRLLGRDASALQRRAKELHAARVDGVGRATAAFARDLRRLGVGARRLNSDDLFSAVWRMANPTLGMRVEPPALRDDATVRCQLFASGCHNRMDCVEADGHLHRVVTLRLPPRAVRPLEIMTLMGLPFPSQLVVTLRRVPSAEAQRRIGATRQQGHEWNRLLSKWRGARRNAALADPHVHRQQVDANDVLARLAAGETLYEAALHVWLCGRTPAELRSRTDLVMSQVRRCGQAEAAVEILQPHVAMLGMLPGHHSLMGDRYHPMLASRAADLLPAFQAWPGSPRPVALLATRQHELVGFEPFSKELQAWNVTVAGGSGSGKSFTTRCLLTGWIASGGRAVIATRGGDYHRYAAVLGGEVVDVRADDPTLSLSPFPSGGSPRAVGASTAAVEHVSSIIAVMATEPGQVLSRQARRLIFRATSALLGQHRRDGALTFADWLSELRNVASDAAETQACAASIAEHLQFWLTGPFGPALKRPRQRPSASSLAVWDLGGIADLETQGVVLALLSRVIADAVEASSTVVVLDEVWSILRSSAGADLVETLYRTVRKEGSSIWTISQSMNDYMGLPDSCRSAILNNSPVKLFLPHDASEIGGVRAAFRLNDRESDLLSGLRAEPGMFSEMLSLFGARRQVLRLCPTPLEYWLATSHPRDCALEQNLLRQCAGFSRRQALETLARRYPHGALDIAASGRAA